jgi:glycerol-3-phosphate dehydrogenase (NAD(P)+)
MPLTQPLAVLGAGAWGTALAIAFSGHHAVRLWCRDPAQASTIATTRENARYLAGVKLPAAVAVTTSLDEALTGAGLIISAVPTAALRATLALPQVAASKAPLLWACKGFEEGSRLMPHQVLAQTLLDVRTSGALSGPSFADEVARGQPTALVAASRDMAFAEHAARQLSTPSLRVYAATDVIGVELGGALKNVIAIAGGIADGLALGRNARAALVTRGLAEMARLGVAMGADAQTFMGLTGLGDLVLTATGDLSRNRNVGLQLAQGKTLADALAALGHVAEGVRSAQSAVVLAEKHQIEMPITRAVAAVLEGRLAPKDAVMQLLSRDVKAEH